MVGSHARNALVEGDTSVVYYMSLAKTGTCEFRGGFVEQHFGLWQECLFNENKNKQNLKRRKPT